MEKQRGYPDRRGLWAESDPISEPFVPNERYKGQQRAMAQTLSAAGLDADQIANMFVVPLDTPPHVEHDRPGFVEDAHVEDAKEETPPPEPRR